MNDCKMYWQLSEAVFTNSSHIAEEWARTGLDRGVFQSDCVTSGPSKNHYQDKCLCKNYGAVKDEGPILCYFTDFFVYDIRKCRNETFDLIRNNLKLRQSATIRRKCHYKNYVSFYTKYRVYEPLRKHPHLEAKFFICEILKLTICLQAQLRTILSLRQLRCFCLLVLYETLLTFGRTSL